MNANEYIGPISNLLLCTIVVGYGWSVWILGKKPDNQPAFIQHAYRWWLRSWIAWIVAWGLILFRKSQKLDDSITLGICIAIFTIFNSILHILVFLILTRGDSFEGEDIYRYFGRMIIALSTASMVLFVFAPLVHLDFASNVLSLWALCMGVLAPMLVGWAVYLRFNSWVLLSVGFVYGLAQPVAYSAERLSTLRLPKEYEPVVAVMLGGLKVVWAIGIVQVLATPVTYSSDESVRKLKPIRESLLLPRPQERANPYGALGKSDIPHRLHATILIFVYICLLIWLGDLNFDKIQGLLAGLTLIAAVLGLIPTIAWILRKFDRGHGRPSGTASPPPPSSESQAAGS